MRRGASKIWTKQVIIIVQWVSDDKVALQTLIADKKTSLFAWALCALISLAAVIAAGIDLLAPARPLDAQSAAARALWAFVPIVFAGLAALILTRQPRNAIGWLMLGPAIQVAFTGPIESYLSRLPAAPADLGLPLFLMLWVNGGSWTLLIFPVLLIPLLFPTGRPPTPRWRWVAYLALGMIVVFFLLATFNETLDAPGWQVRNPIGLIHATLTEIWIVPWLAALVALTLLSLSALFVRYRRGAAVERQQIKWLLYAFSLFAAYYVSAVLMDDTTRKAWSSLLAPALLTIPIAVAIAVLRYRLYDIDLIIRRTLLYSVLTASLGLVYFGGVALLQNLFRALTGEEQSPVVTVITTLAIAGLFTPLRKRIQSDIDRRFYRKKYDAEKTLEAFASSLRNEVDLESLSGQLVNAAQESMQPERVTLWIKPVSDGRQRGDKPLTPSPSPAGRGEASP